MEIKRLRTMLIEIFETLKNQNPSLIKEIFYHSSPNLTTHKKHNLYVHTQYTTRFGRKVYTSIMKTQNLRTPLNSRKFIKRWLGPNCKCSTCKKLNRKYTIMDRVHIDFT